MIDEDPIQRRFDQLLTRDAKIAYGDISGEIMKITNRLDRLTEPALKGLSYRCRQEVGQGGDEAGLWEGVAQACDHHLELLRRYRKGDGIWYAGVNMIKWDKTTHIGRDVVVYHEECKGKKAATLAARKLLKKHADELLDGCTMEASVCTDLEWVER